MPGNQSGIQQLIQQLAGTQSTAQANTPGNANNGNPNTVYNNAPPKVSYNPAQGAQGYLPPVMDGYGNWMINKPQPPASGAEPVDWSKMITDIANPVLPTWNPASQGSWGTPPPATLPSTNDPVPVQPVPGGGNATPDPVTGAYRTNGGGGSVVLESYIDGRDTTAAKVKKGDMMKTIDPRSMVYGEDRITYAET